MYLCICICIFEFVLNGLFIILVIKNLVLHVVCCAIWYHLYNLKNVRNTYGGVLLLVKLQAEAMLRY